MRLFLFIWLCMILLATSCGEVPPGAPINPMGPPPTPPDSAPARISDLEKRLARATEEKDEIARLGILKDLISERMRQTETELGKLKLEKKEAETALESARTEAMRTKLWWFVGIMGVAALALAALAIFIPSVARWAVRGAIACVVISALAVVFAWLLPWLLWIGFCVLFIAIIAALVYWRLDAKSRDQVVEAFDGVKDQVPNYKAVFNQVIDTDADKHLDKVRERLGLKPKRVS